MDYIERINSEKTILLDELNEKRQEINKMQSIISASKNTLSEKELDLLIKSFIVLIYAYWEDAYHKLNIYLNSVYCDTPIKDLPYNLKNKSLLQLTINGDLDIKIDSFEKINKLHHCLVSNEVKSINEVDTEQNNIKNKLINFHSKQNPKIHDFKELLKFHSFNPKKVFDYLNYDGDNEDIITSIINFIISQRNNIAHKNSNHIHNKKSFSTCREVILYYLELQFPKKRHNLQPEDFLKDILFDINNLFIQSATFVCTELTNKLGEKIENN